VRESPSGMRKACRRHTPDAWRWGSPEGAPAVRLLVAWVSNILDFSNNLLATTLKTYFTYDNLCSGLQVSG
jgi:hypothetical protein